MDISQYNIDHIAEYCFNKYNDPNLSWDEEELLPFGYSFEYIKQIIIDNFDIIQKLSTMKWSDTLEPIKPAALLIVCGKLAEQYKHRHYKIYKFCKLVEEFGAKFSRDYGSLGRAFFDQKILSEEEFLQEIITAKLELDDNYSSIWKL